MKCHDNTTETMMASRHTNTFRVTGRLARGTPSHRRQDTPHKGPVMQALTSYLC